MSSPAAARSSNLLSYAVKCKEAKLVAPSLPHPPAKDDAIYWLSNLHMVPYVVHIVFFYQSIDVNNTIADPAMVLQNALAQVLVDYHPLAGRLELSSDGRFQVICSGEGAIFVEAEADANISDVLAENDLDTDMQHGQKLLYGCDGSKSFLDQPLLAIQVTKFKCGGFCVGASFNHCMFDGLAIYEFLTSLGEIARGVPMSNQPALDRTLLKARDLLRIEFPFSEIGEVDQSNSPTAQDPSSGADDIAASDSPKTNWATTHNDMFFSFLSFDSKTIDVLKKQALDEGVLKTCSSFEVVSAFIWRIRTKALGMVSSQSTKFEFPIDCRKRFCPPLPKGHFGNAVLTVCAIASAGELTNSKLSYAVGLIQQAKAIINDKYLRSRIDYLEHKHPYKLSLTSTSLLISSWCGYPFHKADYGWGEATNCFPVGEPVFGCGLFLANGEDGNGIKCVTSLPSFAWGNIKSRLQQQQLQNPELFVEMAAVFST